MNNFSKRVLITGANRGMGLGYVTHYLKAGQTVVATSRNLDAASALLKLQYDYPNQLLLLELDVANEESIANFAAGIKQEKITFSIAINNAGISMEEEFGEWTITGFETQFRINTIGPALVSQAIVPFLEKGAKLVQISSGMGSLAWNINPNNALDAYAASKCALHSLTRRLAEKLKSIGVTVIAVNPGWVQTEMGGQEAPVTIEEAIQNITATIEKSTLKQSGCFLSDEGEVILW